MRSRVRRSKSLSAGQIVLWSTFGLGSGLLAGFALSEWVGGVNQTRMRRAAKSLGHSSQLHHTSAASARAVEGALGAETRLAGCSLEVVPISRSSVELRGWVGDRARPHPGRSGGMRRSRCGKRHQQHPRSRRGRQGHPRLQARD